MNHIGSGSYLSLWRKNHRKKTLGAMAMSKSSTHETIFTPPLTTYRPRKKLLSCMSLLLGFIHARLKRSIDRVTSSNLH
ncbi:hypothetical protein AUG19_01185 [archaeon 13_1_20CM_2_54_9]|nr:MAG: hypothetical protein AUG19_01185 [archaeon 13_1_20CM_2_54_9]